MTTGWMCPVMMKMKKTVANNSPLSSLCVEFFLVAKPKSRKGKTTKTKEDADGKLEDPDEFQSAELDYISDSESEEEERERVTKGSPKKEEKEESEDEEEERPEDEREKRSEDEESENEDENGSDDDLTETGKQTKALLKRREEKSGSEEEGSDVDDDFDADLQDDMGNVSALSDKQTTPEIEKELTEPIGNSDSNSKCHYECDHCFSCCLVQ